MTFDDLCAIEPRLRDLERDVKEFARVSRRKSPRCANAAWYGYGPFTGAGFKPRLLKLVGFEREPPGYVAPELPPLPTDGAGLSVVKLSDPILQERFRLRLKANAQAIERLPAEAQANERVLRDCSAYDVAYSHLYELLPDCRGCTCM
jgi:hypothetical protein